MDFFTVPTVSFGLLWVFVVLHHERRRILHFAVTDHPGAPWITQQLREAFPFHTAPRYAILDRDSKYGHEVPSALQSLGVEPVRTALWVAKTSSRRDWIHCVKLWSHRRDDKWTAKGNLPAMGDQTKLILARAGT
jgi:hypothetical protein